MRSPLDNKLVHHAYEGIRVEDSVDGPRSPSLPFADHGNAPERPTKATASRPRIWER
jgi:hypothetical protein